jgi:hypothetical protein
MFFENNIVVPIQHIKLYWSNKGQKTCAESRLSIRFKIVDKNVVSYIYDRESNELQLNTQPIKVGDFDALKAAALSNNIEMIKSLMHFFKKAYISVSFTIFIIGIILLFLLEVIVPGIDLIENYQQSLK